MITYITKTILCSALLLLIYKFFLEKEKMHRFNRFYLLFSIALSFIAPLITINVKSSINPISESISLINSDIQSSISNQSQKITFEQSQYPNILLLIYLVVSIFFLYRFTKNMYILFRKIKNNESTSYFNSKLVLTAEKQIPHSFLNYIFIYNEDFQQGRIEKEILHHELTHVNQKHSIDISIIELIIVLTWFNPIIFFYRQAVQLNHEFLADESVVSTLNNTQSYQLLLLNKASQQNNLILSSPFNYIITKKRLVMMTKKTSIKTAVIKQIALIPLLVAMVFLFSSKGIAQETLKVENEKQTVQSTKGVTQDIINEYNSIIDKYKKPSDNFLKMINAADRERLEAIYWQMSKEQQNYQTVFFTKIVFPKPIVPTKDQLESFKNKQKYGVWVDGKKIENSALYDYINTDFANVFVSELLKNAIDYGKYEYQVDLSTKKYYQETVEKLKEQKTIMLIRRSPDKNYPN